MSLFKSDLQLILRDKVGAKVALESWHTVGGGCINETVLLKTNAGSFFAKYNDAKRYPGMLAAEAKGLQLLKDAGEIKVPDVVAEKTAGAMQYLVLECIEPDSRGPAAAGLFWERFGKSMARLHRHTSGTFGLDHDNYIGSLPQKNNQHASWPEFFILERLEPQLRMARDEGKLDGAAVKRFGSLFTRLKDLFPAEKPALLHGDLWSGNYLRGPGDEPVIIDPAVYYGHREMDLGMTRLFGGFGPGFYEAYQDEFSLEKGWQQRTDICNLYPLMVHVNLFGGGYAGQVESILKQF